MNNMLSQLVADVTATEEFVEDKEKMNARGADVEDSEYKYGQCGDQPESNEDSRSDEDSILDEDSNSQLNVAGDVLVDMKSMKIIRVMEEYVDAIYNITIHVLKRGKFDKFPNIDRCLKIICYFEVAYSDTVGLLYK